MSTAAQMTNRIVGALQGFTKDQDEQTYLTSSLDTSATSFTVSEPKLVSQGIVEVEQELMWVKAVDNTTSTVTLAPYGRGYMSTTAASHTANVAIVNNPKFPRSQIYLTLNDAIAGLYPDLYVTASTEFSAVAARNTYELPSDVAQVHRVTWEQIGPSLSWPSISRYRFDPRANTTRFPSGKSLDLYQFPIPGRTVRVTYTKAPSTFTDLATDFVAATGLPSSVEDTVIYGACWRLVGFLEPPRLQVQAQETVLRSSVVQPGASLSAARHFLQMYQISLQAERERLLRTDPTSMYFRYV